MYDDGAPWTGDGVTKDAEEVSMGDAKCASRAQEKEGRVPSDDDVMRAAKALANGRPAYHFVKRLFDIVFSAAVLVVLSPVWAVVAIAVKVDDPSGPVLFTQERVGYNGRPFRMLKFRSMFTDAEERQADLARLNEKSGPVFKMRDDPRVTRVGKLLRKTSIDEVPQFVNVLKGDMSVVGPRPALPKEVATYDAHERLRLLVKPGMTCFWQTRRDRDGVSFDEWVDLDLLYIERCGVLTDARLVLRTVGVVFTAQGN